MADEYDLSIVFGAGILLMADEYDLSKQAHDRAVFLVLRKFLVRWRFARTGLLYGTLPLAGRRKFFEKIVIVQRRRGRFVIAARVGFGRCGAGHSRDWLLLLLLLGERETESCSLCGGGWCAACSC